MTSVPKTYPFQEVTTKIEQNPYIWGSKNAPGRLLAKYASDTALNSIGVQKGDPKALKEFFGYQPTQTDYATRGADYAGSTSGNFIRKFDPASGQYRNVVNPDKPVQKAAQGGIMSLQGFAPGGKTKVDPQIAAGEKWVADQAKKDAAAKAAADKKAAKEAAKLKQPAADEKTGFTDAEQKKFDQLNAMRNAGKQMTQAQLKKYYTMADQDKAYKAKAATPNPNAPVDDAPYTRDQALNPLTAYVDENGKTLNPHYQEAIDYLGQMKAPEAYGQAQDMFNDASKGLQSFANYTPSQVSASSINPYEISAQQAAAQQASASLMGAVADISAERASADKMGPIADVRVNPLQYFQMDPSGVNHVSTKDLEAFQMQGPGSWTEEGVQQKYMNPYIQGVIDVSKRQKARDYAMQVNDLNANAVGVGAFGGARQALQTANAARDYQQQLQDLEIQGLSQAYQQGQGQWTTEMQAAQQAAIQNLQSQLSTQSQSSSQSLQAQLANQGIDYNTAVQNLQAKLGVQATEADQMLRAALANQQTQFGVGSLNAQLGTQTNLANMQAALEAAKANQQTQFGVGQTNAQLGTQTSINNAQLGTQASLANAQNALQASLGNQSNSLAAQQANQRAAIDAMIANQNAGLAANQQGIAAYGQVGQNAQGLGSLGNSQAGWSQQNLANKVAAGDLAQRLRQQQLDNTYLGANNLYNQVPNTLTPVVGVGAPVGSNVNTQQPTPLSR